MRFLQENFVEVSITQVYGEWHVAVTEPGRKADIRTFDTEEHAESYAEGQRIRLKVPHILRSEMTDESFFTKCA